MKNEHVMVERYPLHKMMKHYVFSFRIMLCWRISSSN